MSLSRAEPSEKQSDAVERAIWRIEQAVRLKPEAQKALAKVKATQAAWRWVKRLPLIEAMILIALAKEGPRPGAEHEISQPAVAAALGCHRGTINRAFKRLEKRGLLKSTDRTGRPKTYALRFLEIDPTCDDDTFGGILQGERAPPPPSMEELLIELVLDLCELVEEEIAAADQKVVSNTGNAFRA